MNNKGIIALLLIKVCKIHSSHVQLVLTLRLCILDERIISPVPGWLSWLGTWVHVWESLSSSPQCSGKKGIIPYGSHTEMFLLEIFGLRNFIETHILLLFPNYCLPYLPLWATMHCYLHLFTSKDEQLCTFVDNFFLLLLWQSQSFIPSSFLACELWMSYHIQFIISFIMAIAGRAL